MFGFAEPASDATIDSIVNIDLFGYPARKFYIKQGSPYQAEENYIIEGMGGFNGFNWDDPVGVVVSGGIFQTSLSCFQSGDSALPGPGPCPFLTIPTGINRLDNKQEPIIYPNPATSKINVRLTSRYNGYYIDIIDLLGQTILH